MHPINKKFNGYKSDSDYNRTFAVGDIVSYIEECFIENDIILETHSDGKFNTVVIYFNNTSSYKIIFYLKKTITHKQVRFISELLTGNKYYYNNVGIIGEWCVDILFDISISDDGIDYIKKDNIGGSRIIFEFFLEEYLHYIRSRKLKEIYES